MQKLRIFLADDHAVMRAGLKLLINSQPDMEVIGEAGTGKAAYQEAKRLRPDIVLMDLSMPETDGAQATEALKSACPEIKVLVLTVHEDEGYLRLLLKRGASGYVLKSAIAEELVFAIHRVMEGGIYLDPKLSEKLVDSAVRKLPSEATDEESLLSEREMEVLRLIAWGHSNAEIATQLHLSVRTVETYKERLMKKLGLRSRTDIVHYAVRRGWLHDS